MKKDPQLQKKLAGEFFGNSDEIEKLFKNGADGFWAEFNKQQKQLNPINPELTKQAQAFRDATIEFNNALTNFENKVGPGFLVVMKDIVNLASSIPEALTKSNKKLHDEYNAELDKREKQVAPLFDKVPKQPRGDGILAPGDKGYDKAPYIDEKGILHKSSWTGNPNPLFHKSAFMTGADVGLAGLISDGTKSGVLAAFRELMATGDTDLPATTGVPKFTRASYETIGPAAAVGRAIGLRDGSRNEGTSYHDSNAFYDAIIHSEGTAKHGDPYNTSLGYLKSPKPLTQMSMAEVLKWGDYIRHNTPIGEATNSSAKGAFQIVNTTQRAAMKALGIGMSDLFSIENQRRMASWIAKKQGLGAWTSLPLHPKLEARAYRALRDVEANAGRRATGLSDNSTTPSRAALGPQGTIRADIHVHGSPHKATVKSTGKIETKLHRWPQAGMEV